METDKFCNKCIREKTIENWGFLKNTVSVEVYKATTKREFENRVITTHRYEQQYYNADKLQFYVHPFKWKNLLGDFKVRGYKPAKKINSLDHFVVVCIDLGDNDSYPYPEVAKNIYENSDLMVYKYLDLISNEYYVYYGDFKNCCIMYKQDCKYYLEKLLSKDDGVSHIT